MLRKHAIPYRIWLAGSLALACASRAPQAFAQAPAGAAPAPAGNPEPMLAAPAPPGLAPANAAKPAEAPPALDPAALNAKMEKLQQAFDELKARQDDAAAATAASPADDDSDSGEALKIYGFTDVGVQHL